MCSLLQEEETIRGHLFAACCRTAARTLETLEKLKWEVMECPVHSPDLALSDSHLSFPHKLLKEMWGAEEFNVMM
jgi:hypothetical protein